MIPKQKILEQKVENLENIIVEEIVLWTGISQGGNVIELNVSEYKRLKVKVQLSTFITFLEIDLIKQTSGVTKNNINYKYGNAIIAGALDGTQYINKCAVVVSEDKTKVMGYDFGYANLSASWKFQNRDNSGNTWAVLQIAGIK